MRKHTFKLEDYSLYHPERVEVTRHNQHYELDFKKELTIIPVNESTTTEKLLLDFIAAGFILKLKHDKYFVNHNPELA